MNSLRLPTLQQQILGEEALNCLIQDLTAFATILEVRGKGGSRSHANVEALTLADAVAALGEGKLQGVQIRYVFDHREWSDTLIANPAGIQLTRLCASEMTDDGKGQE